MSEQTGAATTADGRPQTAAGTQTGTQAAQGSQGAQANQTAATTTAAQGAGAGTQEQAPGPIPYERFAEVNSQLAEMKKWKAEQDAAAAKAKKDAEAAEAKRLTENNEFKTLAERHAARLAELEPQTARVTALEAAVKSVYEAQLKGLPEAARKAVESLPGLTIEQRLSWLADNAALFTKVAPPDINAGAQSASGLQLDEARAAEIAAIYGVNAKYIQR